jgi:hypothetical protein
MVAGVRLVRELIKHLVDVVDEVGTSPAPVLQKVPDRFGVRFDLAVCDRRDAGGAVDSDPPQPAGVHAAGGATLQRVGQTPRRAKRRRCRTTSGAEARGPQQKWTSGRADARRYLAEGNALKRHVIARGSLRPADRVWQSHGAPPREALYARAPGGRRLHAGPPRGLPIAQESPARISSSRR